MLTPNRDTVGARAHKYVLADLQATPKEIANLAKKRPLDALAHPNCPPDVWWMLAPIHPIEALMSSAGPLYLLEDSTRWQNLEDIWGERWLSSSLWRLDDAQTRLFLADCVEHVLPLYKSDPAQRFCRLSSYWDVPQNAVAFARRMAADETTQREWRDIFARTRDACQSVKSMPAKRVALAALYLLVDTDPEDFDERNPDIRYPMAVVYESAWAYASVVPDATTPEWHHRRQKETAWQWHRLLEYIIPR